MLLIECLKEAKMYLTFHIYQLRKDFTENFEKNFGGYPPFWPPETAAPPRYKGFKFGKNSTKIFEKIGLRTKKCRKSASFQDFVDLFAP